MRLPDWQTEDGRVQLYCGDCLDISPHLSGIDAVVTDPPYGIRWNTDSTRFTGGGTKRGEGRNDWGDIEGDCSDFDPSPWIEFENVVMFGANHFGAWLPVGTTLVWIKRSDDLFGSFLSDAEIAWMKGGRGVYCYRKQFPPPSRMQENDRRTVAHPTQKPIGLMSWCLEKCKGDLTLDPYMGSGTTGVACVRLGRKFIGIEKERKYFDIAVKRITAEMSRTRLFEPPPKIVQRTFI